MQPAKDQHSVQALAALSADQAFRIAILAWRPRRDRTVADTHCAHTWDCVVADAVVVEPVSIPKFLADKEIYREFYKNGDSGTPDAQIMAATQRVGQEFPTQQNRVLFRRNREFWFRNRESSQSNPKSLSDEVFVTHGGTNA